MNAKLLSRLGQLILTAGFGWLISLLGAVGIVIAAWLILPDNHLVLRIFVTIFGLNTILAFLVGRELPTMRKVMLVTNLAVEFLALGYYTLVAISVR